MTRAKRLRALAERSFTPLVLTAVGGVAFVGSATHVYELASAHGQKGASAWEVTALTEVLFAYSGVDLRRRQGWWKLAPVFVITSMIGFMVWANLTSTTDRSFAGELVAVWPAVVFVLAVALAETPSGRAKVSARVERSVVETAEDLEWRDEMSAQTDGPSIQGLEWRDVPAAIAHLRAVSESTRGRVGSVTEPTDRSAVIAAHLASAQPSTRALAERLGVSDSRARALIAQHRKEA